MFRDDLRKEVLSQRRMLHQEKFETQGISHRVSRAACTLFPEGESHE